MSQEDLTLYQKAQTLLSKKDYQPYYQIKAKLKDTPLYSYLQYLEIKNNPDMFAQKTIQDYLLDNKGTYWAQLLPNALASYYAKQQTWPLFLQYYDGGLGVTGQCYQFQAKYQIGDEKAQKSAIEGFTRLWSTNAYLPKACNTFEKIWSAKVDLSNQVLKEKAYLLALYGNYSQALKWIKKTKDKGEIDFYTLWQKSAQNPKKYMDDWVVQSSHYQGFDQAIISIMNQLSRQDTYYAASFWQNFKQKRFLSEKTLNLIDAEIAIDFARAHDKKATLWLAKVKDQYASSLLWQWRLRTALYWGDFKTYLDWYQKLPVSLKAKNDWQYWQAKSYHSLGEMGKAKPVFEKLAQKRSYYGFLAADILKKPYQLTQKDYPVSKELIKAVSQQLTIQQSFDLYQLGEYNLSYDLWRWALRQNNREQTLAAAKLAEDKKMYQLSVYAYTNAGAWQYLQGRFPLAFVQDVQDAAKKFDLTPSLVWSMMRRESMFRIQAESYAGACGLMQLIPSTAAFLSQKYRLNIAPDNYFNIKENILLGTANLNFMDKLFKDNKVLGLAAYNAGQGNVAGWLTDTPMDADRWIETIPFGETREYIKAILAYMVIYNHVILGHNDFRIHSLMPMISKKDKS
ncbi:transglycosylase SLT domain-containing protein [Facilibium subflavum]|uniref:transglycosylase SLT domain-containing protein n=1 Tax=Facilibium subflavum TaxID=2219058 RepID=UPI001AAC679E|nr:transglycosylase SLT domain-containing protein [Facilibium subflavum]